MTPHPPSISWLRREFREFFFMKSRSIIEIKILTETWVTRERNLQARSRMTPASNPSSAGPSRRKRPRSRWVLTEGEDVEGTLLKAEPSPPSTIAGPCATPKTRPRLRAEWARVPNLRTRLRLPLALPCPSASIGRANTHHMKWKWFRPTGAKFMYLAASAHAFAVKAEVRREHDTQH